MKIAPIVLLLLAACACGGESQIYQSFQLNESVETVIPWVLSHQDDIARAMKFRVVSRDTERGLMRLVREIQGGIEYEMTVKETSFPTADGGGVYDATLFQAHRGPIISARTYVRLSARGGLTMVEVYAKAFVADPRARDFHVRTALMVSAKGMERLLKSQFGER